MCILLDVTYFFFSLIESCITQPNEMHNFVNVSNLMGSSSGRQLYLQYGTLYTQRCKQPGG